MILTVAKLEQSVFRDRPISTSGCAIQPHPLGVQLVHTDDALVERHFKVLPRFRLRQRIQHQRQSVIAPRLLPHLLPRASMQRLHALGHPPLHLIHAMVPFRDNVRQPDCGRPAQARALPIAMGLEVLIQQVWDTYVVTLGQQDRYIVHSFCGYGQLFCHTDSLAHFQNLVTI